MTEQCPSCGKPMTSGKCLHCAEQTAFQILRRDAFLLIVLAIVAVLMFFLTRKVAATNRSMNLSMAARQYQIGESELRAGRVSDAIDTLRGAIARDNQNQTYILALANALVLGGRYQEARQILLNLREVTPQSSDISLELARVAAKTGSVSDATRYYQNALYGIGAARESDQERNQVRLEFVDFLVGQKQHALALSELLAFASNLPRHDPLHLRAGQLFLELNDPQRALVQFREIRPSDRGYEQAMEAMALAEFKLSDYESARRYAAVALKEDPTLQSAATTLNMADLVLQNDPLAPGLTSAERIQRLDHSLSNAIQDATACLDKVPAPTKDNNINPLISLRKQALDMRAGLTAKNTKGEIDLLRNGISVVYEIEAALENRCGGGTPLNQALLLVGRKHGVMTQ